LEASGPLALEQAREYVLALVNRDRAAEGLEPVRLDDVASDAGQRHADDMARHGFTAHWGTDGSVPEQRYTEAGGEDFVQENAACFFDEQPRTLDPEPRFDAEELRKIQHAFMSETPPNDGHRQNVLKPWHTHLGVGLAKPEGLRQVCLTQEFVDHHGEYEALPRSAEVGQAVRVAGRVKSPVEFGGVGIARIDPAEPLSTPQLNDTSAYPIPTPYVLFFPQGYQTPKPVELEGDEFSIEVELSDRGKPGRYQISVWGRYPDQKELLMISLRTISVSR
jgi:uncharacterized protein YkwD